jgi:hypothetical protein
MKMFIILKWDKPIVYLTLPEIGRVLMDKDSRSLPKYNIHTVEQLLKMTRFLKFTHKRMSMLEWCSK